MAWFDDLELPGSTITGHFAFVHEDGPDEDDYPDVRLASGTVRFEPTAKAVKAGGAWIGIAPVEAEIFDGELVTSEDDPTPPRILSTDADTGVEGWGWRATFDITGANIKPVTFRAPTEGVHLTGDLIPITGQPVEVIHGVRGDSAYDIAVQEGFEGTIEEWLESLHGGPHTHPIEDIDGLQDQLDDRALLSHPMLYDSGPRNVSGLLVSGWTSVGTRQRLRRQGPMVTCILDIYKVGQASLPDILPIPTGFQPAQIGIVGPAKVSNGPSGWFDRIGTNLRIRDLSAPIQDGARLTSIITWPTNDPIPATLPGEPA